MNKQTTKLLPYLSSTKENSSTDPKTPNLNYQDLMLMNRRIKLLREDIEGTKREEVKKRDIPLRTSFLILKVLTSNSSKRNLEQTSSILLRLFRSFLLRMESVWRTTKSSTILRNFKRLLLSFSEKRYFTDSWCYHAARWKLEKCT